MELTIKHGTEAFILDQIPTAADLNWLLNAIQERTGLPILNFQVSSHIGKHSVLVRQQKLICKGKVITTAFNPSTPLQETGIAPHSKIMLLTQSSSANTNTQSQGHAALRSIHQQKKKKASNSSLQEQSNPQQKKPTTNSSFIPSTLAPRAEMWKKTGIAALRDLKLNSIPKELFESSTDDSSIRIVDLGGNMLTEIPSSIQSLTKLQKLCLNMNALTDQGMPWVSITHLQHLEVLAIDSNCLCSIPECISKLTKLQKLTINNNSITEIPESIGNLTDLKSISARGNKITTLPINLKHCLKLEEADFSKNRIHLIPEEYKDLKRMKILLLDENKIEQVPSAVLISCISLSTLSLHGCPLTIDDLRSTAGFSEFESRRRSKYDKQVDMKVLPHSGNGFDQGADAEEWERWK